MKNNILLLSDIFESRLEQLACLTDSEKAKLNEKKKIIYINDYIEGMNKKQKKQAEEYLDDVMSNVYEEVAIMNDRYYRYGVSDGMTMILESFNIRKEVERWFSKCQKNL